MSEFLIVFSNIDKCRFYPYEFYTIKCIGWKIKEIDLKMHCENMKLVD